MRKLRLFLIDFRKGFIEFGYNLSVLVNTLLLFVVYMLGVGLTSVAAKLAGKRFIEKKISKDLKTYWSDLNLKKEPMEKYYKQF